MSTSQLDRLPIELLLAICNYLDVNDLKALALTSRPCNTAAVALLYRCITVDASRLDHYASLFNRLLQRLSCSRHVRRLTVIQNGEISASTRLDQGDYWIPLVDLIRSLPSLSDLSWCCSSRVPECLLETLLQHLPLCGLHIEEFRLVSPGEPSLTAQDLALATSPNVRSICFKYDEYQSNGEEDFTLEAVARITAGLAPNLRHVRAFRAPAGSSLELMQAWETPRRPFRDNVPGYPKARGTLKQLEIAGSQSTAAQDVEVWSECTDFSLLQTLKLDTLNEHSALDHLASCRFIKLKSLSLSLSEQCELPLGTITEVFCRLPPLSSLTLKGELYRTTLESIAKLHGPTLRTLSLVASGTGRARLVLDAKDLNVIASCCPLLEDLTLSLRRSKGDASEVAAYRILGSLPRLQTIKVFLDASDFEVLREPDWLDEVDDDDDVIDYDTPSDPSFDAFDRQRFDGPIGGPWLKPRNGHIRDAFINSAVDRRLALCIFRTISAAKQQCGSLLRPLEELVLVPLGGGNFGTGSSLSTVTDVVREVGRCWRLKRNVRDDRRDEIVVEELRNPDGMPSGGGRDLGRDVEPIFRRIWPGGGRGCSDWKHDWQSWPLAEV